MITNEQAGAAYGAFLKQLQEMKVPYRDNFSIDRDLVKFQQAFDLYGVLKVSLAAALDPMAVQEIKGRLEAKQAGKLDAQLQREAANRKKREEVE